MRFAAALALFAVLIPIVACSTVPPTHKVGAVCISERTITLYTEPKKPKNPQDLMKMTAGQVRIGEMYEVLKREQVKDPMYGYATEPFWLYIASRERPQVRGWALADPIAAKRVNQ